MAEELFSQRTTTCGALTKEDNNKQVVLNGWVHRDRNHGSLHFINLRDRYGITQVVVDDDASAELQSVANELRMEFCIAVTGFVRLRPDSMVNPEMATGEIEVKAEKIEILSRCAPLPFLLDDGKETREDLRLKYRYLDLRSQGMQKRLKLRHDFIFSIRKYLAGRDFYEIETPTLIKSTPEGARDFVVPSRLYAGKFYALPQSPQLFKQILMVGGFDKYFQIARCYRDEDSRGDRQLEFTQLDLEMSFVKRDDVLSLMEGLFGHVFKEVMNVDLPVHFRRLSYNDSLNTYGCDKPDLRFDLPISDMNEIAQKSSFATFKDIVAAGGFVKALCAPKTEGVEFSRKFITELEDAAKIYGAKGLAWIKVGEHNVLSGGVGKFFAGLEEELVSKLEAKEGDLILFVAHENWKRCCASLSAVRSKLGKDLNLIRKGFEFCWIIDFPLFEYNETEGHWEAAHHMFSMPQTEYLDTLESDPGSVKGDLYDLVLNGYEVASGSIRIHDVELQKRIFRICNFDDETAEERFGFLLNAFRYGPPPHGGIAPGIDRMVMIMSDETSIHEVIAFPKNTAGVSPMDDSPSFLDQQQLDDLHLIIDYPKPKE
ncbi:aspartate--tRNA ligase [Sphaerochaeta sp. PS]|uniref:aspartate--tRNA ligase n=1 Tax=Sphaerochaeta sp. PS TaxID=3076336 RepID=UPI0028A31FBA|nr:aspartate--tRNA ligase [Sphaerochaeta sp. PS]MDT4762609.1 aspartate--tRNA ligase [Sphaerochaeta sp. PS]